MIKVIERFEESDYGDKYAVQIKQEDKVIAGFRAYPLCDCSEDATLERDLYYAYSAVDFFKLGYEAGLRQENVKYITTDDDI